MAFETDQEVAVHAAARARDGVELRHGNAAVLNQDRLAVPHAIQESAQPVLGRRHTGSFHKAIIAISQCPHNTRPLLFKLVHDPRGESDAEERGVDRPETGAWGETHFFTGRSAVQFVITVRGTTGPRSTAPLAGRETRNRCPSAAAS